MPTVPTLCITGKLDGDPLELTSNGDHYSGMHATEMHSNNIIIIEDIN